MKRVNRMVEQRAGTEHWQLRIKKMDCRKTLVDYSLDSMSKNQMMNLKSGLR